MQNDLMLTLYPRGHINRPTRQAFQQKDHRFGRRENTPPKHLMDQVRADKLTTILDISLSDSVHLPARRGKSFP